MSLSIGFGVTTSFDGAAAQDNIDFWKPPAHVTNFGSEFGPAPRSQGGDCGAAGEAIGPGLIGGGDGADNGDGEGDA